MSAQRSGQRGQSGDFTPRQYFNEHQRAEFVDIIRAVIRAEKLEEQNNPPNPLNLLNPTSVAAPPADTQWNAEQIGFFDPDYESNGPVVNSGKYVFYKDVYVFIDRLKDMAPLRGEDKLRTVLLQCFRGTALIQHSSELSELEKNLLRRASLSDWYDALIHRFKERTPVALASLQRAKYTMADTREKKDPRLFVQDIIRHAKAANFMSVQNQLTMAWNNLDLEFRLHIAEPTSTTTIRKFLEDLDGQSDMWHKLARIKGSYRSSSKEPYVISQSSPTAGKKSNKFDRRFDRFNTGTCKEGHAAAEAMKNFMSMFTGQANPNRPYFQNQNRSYPNNFQPSRSSNSEGKKLLQITSGNPSTSDPKKDRFYPAKDDRSDGRRYGKEKKAYVVDEDEEEDVKDGPHGYYQ